MGWHRRLLPAGKQGLARFVEGLNNKIQVIQRRAYGLRNEDYLRLKSSPACCRSYSRGTGISFDLLGDLGQDLFAAAVRTRAAQPLSELLEHAVFESIHHRFVHVALGADRRRIAEVVGSLANGVEHLPPPGAFAGRRRGAGERIKHRDGSEQRAEILE